MDGIGEVYKGNSDIEDEYDFFQKKRNFLEFDSDNEIREPVNTGEDKSEETPQQTRGRKRSHGVDYGTPGGERYKLKSPLEELYDRSKSILNSTNTGWLRHQLKPINPYRVFMSPDAIRAEEYFDIRGQGLNESTVNREQSSPIVLRIPVLGKAGSGKTTLLHRFLHNENPDEVKLKSGVNFYKYSIAADAGEITVNLLDLTGNPKFTNVVKLYLSEARACVLVIDVTDRSSLDYCKEKLIPDLETLNPPNIPVMVVANKTDLSRCVSKREIVGIFKSSSVMYEYYEVSGKTGYNVNKLMRALLKKVCQPYLMSCF